MVLVTTSQPTRSIAPSETSGVSEPKPESNSNVGGIIGGIAGGLLGLVVIIFAIRYLLVCIDRMLHICKIIYIPYSAAGRVRARQTEVYLTQAISAAPQSL